MTNADNKALYRQFCENNDGLHIFMQPWFLDIARADAWDVCLAFNESGSIVGILTYSFKENTFIKAITMAYMCGYSGLWMDYDANWKAYQRLSFEKNTLKKLIGQLPQVSYFFQCYPIEFQNWLPFQWQGYQQSPNMAYVLDGLKDSEAIWANFKPSVRNKIRKAERLIRIEISTDFDVFYSVYKQIYARLEQKNRSNEAILRRFHKEIQEKKCGKLFVASDLEGNTHAVLYVVWDKKSAYYWAAGTHTEHRKSGAMSLLMWEMFKDIAQYVDNFQALGSQDEHLESFMSGLGMEQKIYYKNFKYNNILAEVAHLIYKYIKKS